MKKIYLFASALILSAGLNAQLTNGGFENWTAGEPDGWETLNQIVGQAAMAGGSATIGGVDVTEYATQGTGDAAEGSSYIKMQSFSLAGLDGFGVPDGIYPGTVDQYVVTTTKYESIKFSYRVNLAPGDVAVAFVTASGPGHDFGQNAIGQGFLEIDADASGWTEVTVPIQWFSPDAIDSIQVLFATTISGVFSGYTAPTADGTLFEIDDVQFIEGGSSSIAINEKDVKVFPNPANDFVTFQIDGLENGNVVISSITGQEVVNTSLNGVTKVDVSALNNGVYIYKISNSNGELVKTSKLVIQK